MKLDSIRLAVKQFVQDNPSWGSELSKDACVTKIFNRIVSPLGQLLHAITGGLYGRSTKQKIKNALINAIYHERTGRVTFHA